MIKAKVVPHYKLLGSRADMQCKEPISVINFGRPVKIVGLFGSISSFPRLHVQFILTLTEDNSFWKNKYGIVESDDVIMAFNTGNSGVANIPPSFGFDIITDKVCFWIWAHNMYILPKDYHGNCIIYYEEISRRSRIFHHLKSLFI